MIDGGKAKMERSLKTIGIALLLILSLVGAVISVSAVPVSIDFVKINGDEVGPNDVVKVERGSNGDTGVKIKIRFAAAADAKDLRAEAMLQGYEHGSIRGETDLFDVSAGQKLTEEFTLQLPDDLKTGKYKLRLLVSDAQNPSLFDERYTLDVDAPRHAVSIEDIVLSATEVRAGSALTLSVRVENKGERDEEVKISAALPGLTGAPGDADTIDKLESGKRKNSEELYIRVPACAALGQQKLVVTAAFNDGRDSVSAERTLNVVDGGLCARDEGKTVVTLGAVSARAAVGERASFPITVSNAGTADRTYSLEISGAEWANVEVSPLNVLAVKAGESKTAFVHVTPKEGASGAKSLTLDVKSDGESLKQVALTVSVEGSNSLLTGVVVALIVIIVILVIVGIVVGVSRARGEEEEDTTYY